MQVGRTKHRYLAHKLNFMVLKWAIMEQFHEYLYGKHLVIYTDNNPLTYILTVPNWMQWVTTGLLVWQIIIFLELLIRKDGCQCRCSVLHSKGVAQSAYWSWPCLCPNFTGSTGTTLIEVYSCKMQVTETLDIQKDQKVMSVEVWLVAKSKDPVIREIKYLISRNRLRGCKVYSWDPQIIK